jgi:hypothetical protein
MQGTRHLLHVSGYANRFKEMLKYMAKGRSSVDIRRSQDTSLIFPPVTLGIPSAAYALNSL